MIPVCVCMASTKTASRARRYEADGRVCGLLLTLRPLVQGRGNAETPVTPTGPPSHRTAQKKDADSGGMKSASTPAPLRVLQRAGAFTPRITNCQRALTNGSHTTVAGAERQKPRCASGAKLELCKQELRACLSMRRLDSGRFKPELRSGKRRIAVLSNYPLTSR